MKRQSIHYSLILIISFFIHIFIVSSLLLPDRKLVFKPEIPKNQSFDSSSKKLYIAVNINQDSVRQLKKTSFISDKNSSAKGYLSKDVKKSTNSKQNSHLLKSWWGKHFFGDFFGKGRKGHKKEKNQILNDRSHVIVNLLRKGNQKNFHNDLMGYIKKLKIKSNNMSLKNSIFFTNTKQFSLNTVKYNKYRDYQFFKGVVEKISENWHPPAMANTKLYGYGGNITIKAINDQVVKLFYVIDRKGKVVYIKIVDSRGNSYLDQSCLEAFKLSKKFNNVPQEYFKVGQKYLALPFMFIYYVKSGR